MKVFLDTNILIAASVRQHPHFIRADAVFNNCMKGKFKAVIHAHSLLEFHSAATRLPKGLAMHPDQVTQILEQGILPFVECMTLSPQKIINTQKLAGAMGIVGGVIYDLYLLQAAIASKADKIFTFNLKHFQSLAPEDFRDRITAP
jgi:predicted nucleic acid-binding protein